VNVLSLFAGTVAGQVEINPYSRLILATTKPTPATKRSHA